MKNIDTSSTRPPWRPRKIKGPDQLWGQFVGYAKYVEGTPLYESKAFNASKGTVNIKLRRDRPMTIASFCLFLGVTSQAWRYWRQNRADLAETIERIEDAVYAYKFERAAAGIFKANIISRELGKRSNS